MKRTAIFRLTIAGLGLLSPAISGAQEYVAGPPINCTITRPRPVVSTQYHPQQVTSFCDVTETQMTQRQVVENVPVTTCKTVTRDEGGYQMVWVPKPVTRQVAETRIQQQVKTVSVPVQVKRRVASTSTQMVGVQTVQYVNETVPLQMTAMASTCSSCGVGAPVLGTAMIPATQPPMYPFAPTASAMAPTMPAMTVPSGPTFRAQNPANEPWQTVPARSASAGSPTPSRDVPMPKDEPAPAPRRTSRFSGVPSAAAVWQAQGR